MPDQITELALKAKARGLSFDEFWREAMPVRLCPECGAESLAPTCTALLDSRQPELGECGARTRGAAPPTFDAVPEGLELTFVVWPSDSKERREWLGAVGEGREGWRSAYEGTPPEGRHVALTRLRETLRHLDPDADGGLDRSMAVA